MDSRTISRRAIPGAALALLLWLGVAPVQAQDSECVAGWARSCASVEVAAAGDQLLFYVPNASQPTAGGALGETTARRAAASGQRVRVYRNAPGAACDPVTGRGCVDVTSEWLGPDPEDPEGEEEEEEDGCVDGERRVEEVSGDSVVVTTEDRDAECAAFVPNFAQVGAAVFAVTIPTTVPFWFNPEDEPTTVRFPGEDGEGQEDGTENETNDDSQGGGDGGNGGDGSDGNGSDGNGSDGNGSDGNGSDGNGSDGNGSDGNGSDGNGSDGNGSDGNGSDGNGSDGGDGETSQTEGGDGDGDGDGDEGEEGELAWPTGPSGDQPPMTEVPEPVTTTLVGLGLLGYAGARARRRREEEEDPDGIG